MKPPIPIIRHLLDFASLPLRLAHAVAGTDRITSSRMRRARSQCPRRTHRL